MRILFASILSLLCAVPPCFGQGTFAAPLPEGAKAIWDVAKSYRETTPTRESISINGLWRWQPARTQSQAAPANAWGYFKVPGSWPGISDYMQKDSQTVFAHPNWKSERLSNIDAAWSEREITIPPHWTGRRIALSADYLNSFATVFVDGVKRGELRFPSGELELTEFCQPGRTHLLSMLVVAMPLKGVLLSYADSNSAREVKGRVQRRGLCGDVFLISTPSGPRIADVKVNTSVRRSEITFEAALPGLAADGRYSLRAHITKDGRSIKEFASRSFSGADLPAGRFVLAEKWKPDELWDIHAPQNKYDVTLSLRDAGGRELDESFRVRFGFREFDIKGRDFYLNGSRIFLCAVPLDNAQIGAAWAHYAAVRESLERLQSIGINFVYTHNYSCEPGSHLSFEEVLRAADDVGMLVSLSQPHFSHYDWKNSDADRTNGYARHAEFYVRIAQNHPSVVAYAMSHNATGYGEDMNPDLIDGLQDPREPWGQNNAKLALRAEAIVKNLDSRRVIYHHSSGNLGAMHTANFYPNFTPIQELSDWFEHWSRQGVKPMFTCEYGAPFTWDWTMYRGWYKGQREFGSAAVPWEFCLAEWNAQFLGDRAFQISAMEAANLRWEAKQFQAGRLWHRWDYPHSVGSTIFDERYPVFAMYLADNWPAFRTWEVSAISPWEHEHFWKLRPGVDKRRRDFQIDWENLQRPGFSPDFIDQRYERMDLAFERSDWLPTVAAKTLLRNNGPLLAYIAGKPDKFTSQDHNFFPGEQVEKQIIVINNSRVTVTGEAEWSLGLPKAMVGRKRFALATGEQERIPMRFALPKTLAPGAYQLSGRVGFSGGKVESGKTHANLTPSLPSDGGDVRPNNSFVLAQLSPAAGQSNSFTIHVRPPPSAPRTIGKIALFDPKGETGELLKRMAVRYQVVDADVELSRYDILIVGKAALTLDGRAPNIGRVRDGLKVVLFEQTSQVLEKRFGFRVAEYGLRQVFPRVPDHPLLVGIGSEHLRDWRGEATIFPPRLEYTMRPRYGPTVSWCDIPVPRIWRCGNRGNVASVLIEKPVRGNFLPIIDGGYNLQYSPLLEYREGRGMILFCQMDVTGRTESDPAAETLARNIVQFASDWKPAPERKESKVVYVGDPAGRRHLESTGIAMDTYERGRLSTDRVLVVGPGGGRELAANKAALGQWLKSGGNLFAIGLTQEDADAVLPFKVGITTSEHISAFFEPNRANTGFSGVGPADAHNRDPRALALITSDATKIGNGVLAYATNANVVFCQLVPWQFDSTKQSNLKRTYRRASFVVARVLGNLGVASSSPILERFNTPVSSLASEKRWLNGLYLDQPEEWDDPYRFFRW